MSQLIQLLIGRELARSKGIEDPAAQMRIGAIAMVAPSPMLGIVLANTIATREAPVPVDTRVPPKPGPNGEIPAPGTPGVPATGITGTVDATAGTGATPVKPPK